MATFQAVNTALAVPEPPLGRPGEETTPTTPRPNSNFFTDSKPADDARTEDPSAKTPTRNSFGGLAGQRPLPTSPFTPARELTTTAARHPLVREDSHISSRSGGSQDVEMGGADEEGREGSDDESVNGDSKSASKKKKGQRFFCTEFPPCHLSFTRSEHLARHIRYGVFSTSISQSANIRQQAYRRTAVPVPLLATVLPT
jgi:hypothetical protein